MEKMKTYSRHRISSFLINPKFNVSVIYFFAYASWAAWWPLFTVYLKEAGLTGMKTGIVASIAPVLMFIVQPLWGIVADRWGRKKLLIIALLLSALSLIGFLWIQEFWPIFILTLIFSIFLNPVYPIIDALALDSLGEKKDFGFGYLRLWGAVGWLSGAFMAGQIAGDRNIVTIFLISAVLLILASVFAFRFYIGKETKGALDMSWKNLSGVLRNRKLLLFLFFVLFISVGMNGILSFYGVYMVEIGASRKLIGWAISLQGLSELPFYLASAFILVRFGYLRTLIFTFFVLSVRAMLYAFISTPDYVIFVELTHGLSLALLIVAGVEYINSLVPPQWRATGQSLFWAAIYGAGNLIGNIGVGSLYDHMSIQNIFQILGWFLLLMAILAVFSLKGKKTVRFEKNNHL